MAPQRLSIARRSLLDLPLVVPAGAGSAGNGTSGAARAESAHGAPAGLPALDALALEQESDLGSAFDVPAFLRRQEG
jgi:hypothetical protein